MSDPIFALASAKGRAGIAVIRLSGTGARAIAEALTGGGGKPLPIEGRCLRDLTHGGEILDRALIVTFAAGASFTGEEVVEFHCHGSPAVVGAVLSALSEHARLAEPGEFTKRALENEELDLAQVEGLADLIEAETEAQRKIALRVMQGGLSQKVADWRRDLIRAVSLIEATIDFADEDVPTDVSPEVLELVGGVEKALHAEIKGSFAAERIREGFEVAIVGPPNIGKSTLLNALAGREAAITSEVAGTTRDVIEVRMDIGGLAVTLLDTAGIRETDDQVEAIGVDRAKARATDADLRVFLTQDGTPELEPQDGDIVAIGKADDYQGDAFAVSGKTGKGIDTLISRISETLEARASMAVTATRARHRAGMEGALPHLAYAQEHASDEAQAEIVAAELKEAIFKLSSLIGAVGVEDILDEIFASFCLGK